MVSPALPDAPMSTGRLGPGVGDGGAVQSASTSRPMAGQYTRIPLMAAGLTSVAMDTRTVPFAGVSHEPIVSGLPLRSITVTRTVRAGSR